MKGSDIFVKALENEGVEYIFGVPGEENLDLLESLRNSSIKFVVTRHEQSAGFMAATYGRLTGKAGVALSTLGPGATNFVTAAAYAQLGGMPFVMITGQKPINDSKQGRFQIIDTVEIMDPVTKYSKQIDHANLISSTIRQGFKEAQTERPGAVHIVLPEDIAREESNVMPFPNLKTRRAVAEEKAIAQAVEMIENAKSPLLLIGAGANRTLTSKMLGEFIEKTRIPFFNTQMGKGVIDERNENYIGTAALSTGDFVHQAVKKSDLIINVGHDVIEKPPYLMNKDRKKVIHINFFPAHVDNVYAPELEVIGDIANAIWQMKEKINVQKEWDFTHFHKVKDEFGKHVEKNIDISWPIKPIKLVNTIREIVPDDGILTLDNGMYKIWFARHYKTYERNTLLLDNALATMGAGLPSGIGAKLVHPEKKVITIAGDGGFMMNSQELETTVRLDIDLVVIILKDNEYGMIKWKQESSGFTDFALKFSNPDFVKYAESYGTNGYSPKSYEEFTKLLSEKINAKGIHLFEIPIDYSDNIKILVDELKELNI